MTGSSNFIRLLNSDDSWQKFEDDWRQQCDEMGEEFDTYAEATLGAVRDIVLKEEKKAGVFALAFDGSHHAMCQVNTALLPGYDGPVLRVRFITLSPKLDLGDNGVDHYARVMIGLLIQVLKLASSHSELKGRHVKFHLRSPADTQFFQAIGRGLHDTDSFETVVTRGSWLYITIRITEP